MYKTIKDVFSSDLGKTIQVIALAAFLMGFFVGVFICIQLNF